MLTSTDKPYNSTCYQTYIESYTICGSLIAMKYVMTKVEHLPKNTLQSNNKCKAFVDMTRDY